MAKLEGADASTHLRQQGEAVATSQYQNKATCGSSDHVWCCRTSQTAARGGRVWLGPHLTAEGSGRPHSEEGRDSCQTTLAREVTLGLVGSRFSRGRMRSWASDLSGCKEPRLAVDIVKESKPEPSAPWSPATTATGAAQTPCCRLQDVSAFCPWIQTSVTMWTTVSFQLLGGRPLLGRGRGSLSQEGRALWQRQGHLNMYVWIIFSLWFRQ